MSEHTATSPAGAAIEYGSLTFDVRETLRGAEAKRLLLPYSRSTRLIKSDYFSIWPDKALLDAKADVCIIVVPHTFDRTAPVVSGIDQAVSHVFVADGPQEKAFAWVRRVIDLQQKLSNSEDRAKATKALADATADPDGRVRSYAVDALLGEFMSVDPAAVVDALRAELANAGKLGLLASGEASHIFDRLRQTVRDAHAPLDVRRGAARALALVLADATDQAIRDSVARYLAAAVAELPFDVQATTAAPGFTVGVPGQTAPHPLPFAGPDLLSADEAAAVNRALDALAADPEQAVVVRIDRQWLGGGGAKDAGH